MLNMVLCLAIVGRGWSAGVAVTSCEVHLLSGQKTERWKETEYSSGCVRPASVECLSDCDA